MKTVSLFALILAACVSCKKDNPTPAPSLVGRWAATTIRTIIRPTTGAPSDQTGAAPSGNFFEFKDGADFTARETVNFAGTYAKDGAILTLTYPHPFTPTVTATMQRTIVTLSEHDLVLSDNTGSGPLASIEKQYSYTR